MLSSIADLDPITAAGVLARTAVSINAEDNPASAAVVPKELERRRAVLDEIRNRLGISFADMSEESLDRVGDELDSEIEFLIPEDSAAAIESLSNNGRLPSDLFVVAPIKNLADFHGSNFGRELEFIEESVKNAEREQHFGEPAHPKEPFLISLFAKRFTHRFSLKSFTMLVAGQRAGTVLTVCQAWRLYDDLVKIAEGDSLVDVLRKFSDAFAADLLVNGRKGHFFLSEEVTQDPTSISIANPLGRKNREVTWTCFMQSDPARKSMRASLIVGVDLTQYRRVLNERRW